MLVARLHLVGATERVKLSIVAGPRTKQSPTGPNIPLLTGSWAALSNASNVRERFNGSRRKPRGSGRDRC